MGVSEFELSFQSTPLGFTVESLPLNGAKGAIVTRVVNAELSKRLHVQSTISKVNGCDVENLTQPEIVTLIRNSIQSGRWPLKVTFKPPRQVTGAKKGSPRLRSQATTFVPRNSPLMHFTSPHQINNPALPPPAARFNKGDRVEGMGSGPKYGGKWFPGTITSVKFQVQRGTYNYRIEFDQTPKKSYPIAATKVRMLHNVAESKLTPQAIEFIPGEARHETRLQVA